MSSNQSNPFKRVVDDFLDFREKTYKQGQDPELFKFFLEEYIKMLSKQYLQSKRKMIKKLCKALIELMRDELERLEQFKGRE